jgi:hypothetical protein
MVEIDNDQNLNDKEVHNEINVHVHVVYKFHTRINNYTLFNPIKSMQGGKAVSVIPAGLKCETRYSCCC